MCSTRVLQLNSSHSLVRTAVLSLLLGLPTLLTPKLSFAYVDRSVICAMEGFACEADAENNYASCVSGCYEHNYGFECVDQCTDNLELAYSFCESNYYACMYEYEWGSKVPIGGTTRSSDF